MNNTLDIMACWLASGMTARICGLDLSPVAHPLMPSEPQRIVKGQASAYFLRQHPHGHLWLLKTFHPGRRPGSDYLQAINACLPGGPGFVACTQRRLLDANHLDRRNSPYSDPALAAWLDGAILMPKVPGSPWLSVADSLRDGDIAWTDDTRICAGLRLAEGVASLEASRCSHRDLGAGNVFVTEDGQAYFIDWDSLYHPDLPFPRCTTLGTNGYIAPFLQSSRSTPDPATTWCPRADRFSLAILVAEFLLVGTEFPLAQEDGGLFAQSQIDNWSDPILTRCLDSLSRQFPAGATLFRQAMAAQSFDRMPSPQEWIGALRGYRNSLGRTVCEDGLAKNQICPCSRCGAATLLPRSKARSLESAHIPVLCRQCLRQHLEAAAAQAHQRDQHYPSVHCEHCLKAFRTARARLEELRGKARPILCPECLSRQLQAWERERQQQLSLITDVICARCGTPIRMNRLKVDSLLARGRQPLCGPCLEVALAAPLLFRPRSPRTAV